MGNSHYVKGVAKERRVVNRARMEGMTAFRSAGSHSPIDVVIIDVLRHEIHFIQCKPDDISENQRQKLLKDNEAFNGDFKVFFEVE